MKHCDTCKWWKDGECDLVDYSECNFSFHTHSETLFGITAEVLDDSGLDVRLRTGPKFGCIHHKE